MLAQDALVSALKQWPKSGMPDKPGAWLMPAAKLRAFDRLRRTKLIARKHEELGRERAAEGEAAQPDLDAALDDNIACACISGKTASDVAFWLEAEVSCLRVIRPLYGTKRTSASAAPMSQNDP